MCYVRYRICMMLAVVATSEFRGSTWAIWARRGDMNFVKCEIRPVGSENEWRVREDTGGICGDICPSSRAGANPADALRCTAIRSGAAVLAHCGFLLRYLPDGFAPHAVRGSVGDS